MPIGASGGSSRRSISGSRASRLKPDKDLIATIDKKLKDGLADTPATKAANSNVQKIAD